MRGSCQFLIQLPECLQLAQHGTAWRQTVHLSAHAVHPVALHGTSALLSSGMIVARCEARVMMPASGDCSKVRGSCNDAS